MSERMKALGDAQEEKALKVASEAYGSTSTLTPEDYDRLLMDQLPEVHYIARRIHDRLPKQVALEDLVQAGIVGLMEAIHKFNPSKHVQLKTYAKYRIKGAMLDSLRCLDWGPRSLRRKARELEEAHGRLRARLGRAASETELAAELKIPLHDLHTLLGDLRGLDLGSLHSLGAAEGHEEELQAYHPDAPDDDPYYLCLKSEMKDILARAIRDLPGKESLVLSLYYYEELTMKEVGAVLGVGEARVSQIHSSALVHLRERMRELLGPHAQAGTLPRGAESAREHAWKKF